MASEAMMAQLRSDAEDELSAADSTLVTIQAGYGSKPPLFCVHAETGEVAFYDGVARYLAADQPVLGLQAPPASVLRAHERLEQMAERQVREIRNAQTDGPYLIAAECMGGALAYEIAQQLRAAGQEVALLALIDAFPTGLPRLRSFMPRALYRLLHRARILGFHLENLVRLNASDKLAYVAAKAERARKALQAKVSMLLSRSTGGVSPRLVFREAIADYKPGSYPGSMVLFRAAKLPSGVKAPPDLGWGGLVEHLELEVVPGYFGTPISEPGVRTLAGRLSRHLGACSGEG